MSEENQENGVEEVAEEPTWIKHNMDYGLEPQVLFGLRHDVRNNLHFVSEEEVLYPVEGVLCVHNVTQKRQRFIKLPDKGSAVSQLVLSPNSKLLAVIEKSEKPLITLYDLHTCKKKRQLTIPPERETQSKDFTCCSFTNDSVMLMAVSGEPDWTLFVFKVSRGKVETFTRANNYNFTGTVYDIVCNPNDPQTLCLIGEGLFRLMVVQENVWRQYGYNKAEGVFFKCAAWLAQDRLVAGTTDGKLIAIENGELRAEYDVFNLEVLNLKSSTETPAPKTSQYNFTVDKEIRCLKAFSKGFVFAYGSGTVYLFEKETPQRYKKRNIFKVPDSFYQKEVESSDDLSLPDNQICNIAVSVDEDTLLVTVLRQQIYQVHLWGTDKTGIEVFFQEYGPGLHHGRISSVSVCPWKPIFMTSGEFDCSLRIWNFEELSLTLVKTFQENAYGVALHPTGSYCVAGFSDKLRFMAVLIDDLELIREFPIRNCRECSFSNSGHMFVAVNGNIIQVYSSITFENVFNLKGHNGQVRSTSWSHNDLKMVSCGSEGAVYEWDMTTGRRVGEVFQKSCSFTAAHLLSDGRCSYAVGNDGHIKDVANSTIIREIFLVNAPLEGLVLSQMDTMMIVAGNVGTMYSIKIPILEKVECLEYNVHRSSVNNMVLSYDDKIIVATTEAGTLAMWKLMDAEGKGIKRDKDFSYSTNVLISMDELSDKMSSIRDLSTRMKELETEHAYQIRQNDTIYNDKLKEVHEGYCAAIEELKDKNEQIEAEHAIEIHNIKTDIAKMKSVHEHEIEDLEANYNEKLIVEYNKYLQLEDKKEQMRMRYEHELEEIREAKKVSEEEITNTFVEQLNEKSDQLDEVKEELRQNKKEHETIKQQIEDDADREIYDLKTAHEGALKAEQEMNIRLRGEVGVVRKKLVTAQKQIDEFKHHVKILEAEHSRFKNIILNLERDIADLKKEIIERDETIQEKEKRIYDLKRKNQELEKFKCVLEYKIKELKSQIEPREKEIREQKMQIADMVTELETLQHAVMTLDVQLNELREKLGAADAELRREVEKNRRFQDELKTIRTDIHNASGLIQEPAKLKNAIKQMYHKYNADKNFTILQSEDAGCRDEFTRQRDFLERTVNGLKRAVARNTTHVGADKHKIVSENATLLEEMNMLRKDLRLVKKENNKMEALLGMTSKHIGPLQAKKKMDAATDSRKAIHSHYKEELERQKTMVALLKEDNERIRAKYTCLLEKEEPPPPSETKPNEVVPDLFSRL